MTNEQKMVGNMTVEQWLAIRKAAALQVDPETAEVMWQWASTLDPYGVCPESDEYKQIGREYFARPAGSDVWVSFDDLPEATVAALQKKMEQRRAFPQPTVYRRSKTLLITGKDDFFDSVCVPIEQEPKLIDSLRAALREHEADAS